MSTAPSEPEDNLVEADKSALTRVTFNLGPRAVAALDAICSHNGENKTDAINRALRSLAALQRYSHPDGSLHVTADDGIMRIIHVL
jgi:hypothetical protein